MHDNHHTNTNITETKDFNNNILIDHNTSFNQIVSNTRRRKSNEIIIDKDENGYISSYLTCNDFIHIDPYKMNQVISNIVSNAIKFTPVGQTVTIKARKIIPDSQVTRKVSISNSPDYERKNDEINCEVSTIPLEKIENDNSLRNMINYFLSRFSIKRSNNEYDIEAGNHIHENTLYNGKNSALINMNFNASLKLVEFGYLLVEVSDSGVGMAPEDSKRLFKEIVQFNPSKLQVSTFIIKEIV